MQWLQADGQCQLSVQLLDQAWLACCDGHWLCQEGPCTVKFQAACQPQDWETQHTREQLQNVRATLDDVAVRARNAEGGM